MTPPPLEFFRKFIRFGTATRPEYILIQRVLEKIDNSPFGWGGLLPHRLDHQEVKVH